MPALDHDWLLPIEREAASLLVELLRLGTLERVELALDADTGAIRVQAAALDGREVSGLLALADLPLP